MASVELLFLGSGTSAGVPMIGCKCPVCTSSDPRDKRTRPSVVVSYNGVSVLVDTTPELRLQCVAHAVERVEAVVFTHAHADHIMGLDDVRRFNTIKGGPLDVWADARTFAVLSQCFGYAFKAGEVDPKVYRPQLVQRVIDGPFEIGGVEWRPVPLLHAKAPILGFRVGKMAYCTDVSEIPEASFGLLEGLDVLVLDALQFEPHASHFSIPQAIEAAKRIGAKRTYFTHIAHRVSHAAVSETLPDGIQLAYDGLRVTASL